jgi:hypothetical protein
MTNTLIARHVARPSATPPADGTEVLLRLGHIHRVLETARTLVERGWLQHGWYRIHPSPPLPLLARLRLASRTPTVDEVGAACLVAAVALAAHGGGPRPDVVGDAGPSLDVVWRTLQADRSDSGIPGRVPPPAVRAAQMRDLVRWNDAPGRTRHDVLDLLDRSISRTLLAAAAAPPTGRWPIPAPPARPSTG